MTVAFLRFERSLNKGDIVLFYFSGHGTQWEDQNYLIPLDNLGIDSIDLRTRAINAQDILYRINSKKPLATIFILDCCRKYHLRNGSLDRRNRATTSNQPKGLKAMADDHESLIVFACAAGATSDEQKADRNGLFTKHFLRHVHSSNEHVLFMLADVMKGVKQESNEQQIPYIYSSLTNKSLYLNERILGECEISEINRHVTAHSDSKIIKKLLDLRFHDNQRQKIVRPHEIRLEKENYPPTINDTRLLDRIQGSIFGLATGDALGAHVEFRPRTYLKQNRVTDLQSGGKWGLDKGQFTDDTSMALCLAISLIVCKEFEPYDQLLRYKWWYRYGYMSSTGDCFDIESTTRQSIQLFEKRQKTFAEEHQMNLDDLEVFSNPDLLHEFDFYCSKEGVAGNGALMRLAPVPLFLCKNPTKAILCSGISGQITHGDRKASDACRYYAALIIGAIQNMKKEDLLKETFYEEHKQWFGEKDLHQDILNIAKGSFKKPGGYEEGIRGKGYIVDALEAALWAFWSDGDSFEQGALNAVNLGDDTDTTAAIYGQLAGAFYGFDKLPKKWIDQIYAKDFLIFLSQWITHLTDIWAIKPNRTSLETLSSSQVERKAISGSGQVGYLYDVIHDSLFESTKVELQSRESLLKFTNKFVFKKGNESECQNILRFVGFDDELRLSILLNIVQPKGIASVINYPFVIDEFTRIIFYSKTTRHQSMIGDLKKIQLPSQSAFTHLITEVYYGIDLIIILRLSSQHAHQIDQLLQRFFQSTTNDIRLLEDPLINQILSTFVYSNIPLLNEQKSLKDIFKVLSTCNDPSIHWPLRYTLQRIEQSYPIQSKVVTQIEQILSKFASIERFYKTIFDKQLDKTIQTELKDQLDDLQTHLNKLTNQYQSERERFKQGILNSREKNSVEDSLLFSNEQSERLNKDIDNFIYLSNDIKNKQDFINELNRYGFIYWNVVQHKIDQQDNINTIQQKLIQNNQQTLILCSNDFINLNNWSSFDRSVQQLTNQKATNSSLTLIYADFSYCPWELDRIIILPKETPLFHRNPSNSASAITTERPHRPPQPSDEINVLLFGKSGVGKSALINNFVNYLQFDHYDQINLIQNSLRVLISFIHPISNNENDSENHFVQIGSCDHNENYEHSNQPTTQLCKSHGLLLKDQKQTINWIDTPGFGKTKNPKDDELLIEEILSKIINLSHLDAICILIQSDENDLDSYRVSLQQLFHIVDDQQKINVFFIFTKYLSKPIDQNQQFEIVRKLADSISKTNIKFNQENIFTFDSTYFHQLSLFQHFQRLIDFQDDRSRKSWDLSKGQWDRFVSCLVKNRHPLILYASLEKKGIYLLEISQLIRPIFEALRNSIRNNLLNRYHGSNNIIELIPIRNNHPSAICSKCSKKCQHCGPFWIVQESHHEYRNSCNSCSCSPSDHYIADYRILYKYSSNRNNQQWNLSEKELLSRICQLSYFIFKDSQSQDLFLFYLDRIIEEEKYIYASVSSNSMNIDLHNYLKRFKQIYRTMLSSMVKNPSSQTNLNIDDIIEDFKQIPLIKQQLNAATIL